MTREMNGGNRQVGGVLEHVLLGSDLRTGKKALAMFHF